MGNGPHAFEPQGKELDKLRSEYEKTIEQLYAQVGRLTTELTWLKKRSPTPLVKTVSFCWTSPVRSCPRNAKPSC